MPGDVEETIQVERSETMKTACLMMIAVATGFGPASWAQTNLSPTLPSPTTNTLPITLSLTSNAELSTNTVSRAGEIDTSRLAKEIEGTDAMTKQKVAVAIEAIRTGNDQIAVKELQEVRALTSLSTDQLKAVDAMLAQLRRAP